MNTMFLDEYFRDRIEQLKDLSKDDLIRTCVRLEVELDFLRSENRSLMCMLFLSDTHLFDSLESKAEGGIIHE